jgi:hypothetical protein
VALAAALASGVLMYACGGPDAPPPPDLSLVDMAVPVPHNFEQINDLILTPSCSGFSTCHSRAGQAMSNMLNLCAAPDPTDSSLCDASSTLKDAWAALYKQPSVNDQAKAEGLLLVNPCNPDMSFLIKKFELPVTQIDDKIGYGAHMPHGVTTPFPPAQLQAIRDWISRGAHLDEPANVSGSTCTMGGDGGT